jgi:hypothetical protein
MKTSLFFAVFFISGFFSFGQNSPLVSIRATSLTDPDKTVFYTGITNTFTVSVKNIAPENILVRVSIGNLTGSRGKYSITVTRDTDVPVYVTSIFVSYLNNHRDTIPADTIRFEIKRIPDPMPVIGGMPAGKIRKDVLLAADSMLVVMPQCFLDLKFTVVSFTLTLADKGCLKEYDQPAGNKLTQEQKEAIKNAPPKTKLYFENIKCIGSDGLKRALGAISLLLE